MARAFASRRTKGVQKVNYEPPIYPFQIDFMRHVSNIVYIQWMEIGRCLLLDAVGMSVAEVAEQGFGPVLVETIVSYKKPLRLGDPWRQRACDPARQRSPAADQPGDRPASRRGSPRTRPCRSCSRPRCGPAAPSAPSTTRSASGATCSLAGRPPAATTRRGRRQSRCLRRCP